MKTTTWLNLDSILSIAVAALIAGGAALPGMAQNGGGDDLAAQEIAARSRAAYAALSSYSDSGTVVSQFAGQKNTLTFNMRLQRPNQYRIDWREGTGPENVVWSDRSGNHVLLAKAGQESKAKPETVPTMKLALGRATGFSWSAASTIPSAFFGQDLGDVFVAPVAAGRYPLKREADAKVGDVDCYVVSCVVDGSKQPGASKPGTAHTQIWFGKTDLLIHQSRTTYFEKVDNAPPTEQAIDDAIKKSLVMQNKPVTPEAIAAMRPQMRAIMKQVQTTVKSGFDSGAVFTQTHENIVVNKALSPAEFTQ